MHPTAFQPPVHILLHQAIVAIAVKKLSNGRKQIGPAPAPAGGVRLLS